MDQSSRIAVLSLNPAIDQTARVPGFTAGRVNRVEWTQSDAGGKGVNVASFLADAGVPVTLTGLLGAANAEPFTDLFARKGIGDRCLRLPGATRVNVKITDPLLDQVTDINFPGLSPSSADLDALQRTLAELCADHDGLVLTGSVPAGVPEGFYADLVRELKSRGKTVLLDASGAPFAAALRSGPDIVKPNIDELRELTGRDLEHRDQVLAAARSLVAEGIGLVVISMGADGALFVEADRALLAVPPQIEVASTVGAGDAMVAGILAAGVRGLGPEPRARLATAFSLCALGQVGADLPGTSFIDAYAARVQIRGLNH